MTRQRSTDNLIGFIKDNTSIHVLCCSFTRIWNEQHLQGFYSCPIQKRRSQLHHSKTQVWALLCKSLYCWRLLQPLSSSPVSGVHNIRIQTPENANTLVISLVINPCFYKNKKQHFHCSAGAHRCLTFQFPDISVS